MKPEIDIKTFYNIGIFCFGVIGLMALFTLIINWETTQIFGKISSFASITFNVALVLFFNYLRNQLPKIDEKDMPKPEELENFLDDLK